LITITIKGMGLMINGQTPSMDLHNLCT